MAWIKFCANYTALIKHGVFDVFMDSSFHSYANGLLPGPATERVDPAVLRADVVTTAPSTPLWISWIWRFTLDHQRDQPTDGA
ncbi:hypothetical protein PoB_003394500 [Plakobranchus ocellatus]|uniref:Uncharacterized protein n=1 Tax=Plakobranchus ocellatus TaxID=259542 RepID=A0AAV4AKP9_9GAST|nr:hypothetical protein PoB_003394500 [Plakobranchus ocellatus]